MSDGLPVLLSTRLSTRRIELKKQITRWRVLSVVKAKTVVVQQRPSGRNWDYPTSSKGSHNLVASFKHKTQKDVDDSIVWAYKAISALRKH